MTFVGLKRFVLVALAAAAVSCGGGDDNSAIDSAPNGPDAEPSSVMIVSCTGVTPAATITTSGFAFSPSTVTISAGDVLLFAPAGPHNMTGGQPGAPSGQFAVPTGAESCLLFMEAGSFPFFCSVHPTMTGTVTVQ